MSNPITPSGPQSDEVIPLSHAEQRQMHKPANQIGRTDMDEITSRILFETSASPRIWEIEADALRMPEGRQ